MQECLYELSKKPDTQAQVRSELISFEEDNGRAPNYDDLMNSSSLPYFDALIRETLRTKSVLMAITREVIVTSSSLGIPPNVLCQACRADTIPLLYPVSGTADTLAIPVEAGQKVYIPVRDGVNADEDFWGLDAAEFRPERWLEEDGLPSGVKDLQAPGHHLSFGDG